ncbi:MAG: serine/threonine protein kinase, partial [Anaerolineales bacterium]|nr:serine/threonine protein kinase [Anaerolineales bacterium]
MSDPLNLAGQRIDHFLVKKFVAKGGMAAVYLALDTTLDRHVALKVILPDKAREDKSVARFEREARTVARLTHPNIIPIYYTGKTANHLPYIVMEFITGGSLHNQLQKLAQQGRLQTPVETLQQMRKIIEALGKMHQSGIVHRDLKPANILLRDEATPLLADLGIASVSDATTKLTRTGTTLGTPAYMSPEQVRGQELDGRSDLYTMGIILYQLLSGQLPFTAQNQVEYLRHHLRTPPPPLRQVKPDLASETGQLVDKCLHKEPEKRFQTAEEMLTAVDRAIRAEQKNPTVSLIPSATLPTIKEAEIYSSAPRPATSGWQPPRTVIAALVATAIIAVVALFALRGGMGGSGDGSGEETAVLSPTSSNISLVYTDTPTPEPTSTLLPTTTPVPPTATATPSPEPTIPSTANTPIVITIATPIPLTSPTPNTTFTITATCQQSAGDRWGTTLYPANDNELGCPLNQPHG